MLLYYAHAMCLYGTERERSELDTIVRHFPTYTIVNPTTLQSEADASEDGMGYFLRMISFCHVLVFSRLMGRVTAGVGLEVNHALSLQRPVYELVETSVVRVENPITALTRDETTNLFTAWRTEEQRVRAGKV